MKKINFTSFFPSFTDSRFALMSAVIAKTVIPLYFIAIVSTHSLQLYKWYTLSIVQKNNLSSVQNLSLPLAGTLLPEKDIEQKIEVLNLHKKAVYFLYDKLKTIYTLDPHALQSCTLTGAQFTLIMRQPTYNHINQWVTHLKKDEHVKKIRIMHITKKQDGYSATLKGEFTHLSC